MSRITVAEKDPARAAALRDSLSSEGHDVALVDTGDRALAAVHTRPTDLLIVGHDLDRCRTAEVLRRIRRSRSLASLPVIVNAEGADAIDRVIAFELGADDVLETTSSARELALRIGAVLRRVKSRGRTQLSRPTRVGPFEFQPRARQLELDGRRRRLTPVESRLLETMLERPDQVWHREELIRRVWDQPGLDPRTVDSHVRRLRKKLTPWHDVIETVRGVGYRIRAQSPPS